MQRRTILLWLLRVVGVATAFYCLLFVSVTLSRLGIYLLSQQHQAAILGGSMALTLLTLPARGGERCGVPWYDTAAILATVVNCIFTPKCYRSIYVTIC